MNKIKYLIYLILIVALAILVAENFAFFSTKQALVFNLKYKVYNIPAIPTGLFIFGAFVIGYFFAYINGLFLRFHTNRTVKTLNVRMKAQLSELSSLRKEVEFLQRNPVKKPEPPKKEKEREEQKVEAKSEPATEVNSQAAVQN